MLKVEEGNPGAGFVTLGRGDFDLLCSKLNGLEDSIADLRRELHRNSSERTVHHDSSAPVSAPALMTEPRQRRPTHTDVHGIHTRNDAVRAFNCSGMLDITY